MFNNEEKKDIHVAQELLESLYSNKTGVNKDVLRKFRDSYRENYEICEKLGNKVKNIGYYKFEQIVRKARSSAEKAHKLDSQEKYTEAAEEWGKSLGLFMGFIQHIFANHALDGGVPEEFGEELDKETAHTIALEMRRTNRRVELVILHDWIYLVLKKKSFKFPVRDQEDYLRDTADNFR